MNQIVGLVVKAFRGFLKFLDRSKPLKILHKIYAESGPNGLWVIVLAAILLKICTIISVTVIWLLLRNIWSL